MSFITWGTMREPIRVNSRWHGVTLALLACSHAIWQAQASGQSVADVAREVTRNYERFRQIPNLTVKFSLDYKHLNGQRKFGFDSVLIETRRHSGKLQLRMAGVQPTKNSKGSQLVRMVAWDGKAATGLEPSTSGSGEYSVGSTPSSYLYYFNYYVDFLSYPDGSGSVPGVAQGRKPAALWLPRILTDNLARYHIRAETEDNAPCHVLENPDHESFWFDPDMGYALRRRDSYDPETGSLRHRTVLKDFRSIGGVWLPAKIIQEEFGGPDDPKTVVGQPRAKKTITVSELSTEEIPESAFRLEAPVGVVVHDVPRKVFYTRYKTGENPIVASAELARDRYGASFYRGWGSLLAALAMVPIITVLAWVAWRAGKNDTRRNQP